MCNLNINLATHENLQMTKCELTDFGSRKTCEALSAVASLIIHIALLECF